MFQKTILRLLKADSHQNPLNFCAKFRWEKTGVGGEPEESGRPADLRAPRLQRGPGAHGLPELRAPRPALPDRAGFGDEK